MEVFSDTAQVVIIEVFIGRWTSREFFLHNSNQLLKDLIHLIPSKQARHLKSDKRSYYFITQICKMLQRNKNNQNERNNNELAYRELYASQNPIKTCPGQESIFVYYHSFEKRNVIWWMYVWISTRMCTSFTSPDDRMLFIYSRKASSFISLSVNKNVTPLPC